MDGAASNGSEGSVIVASAKPHRLVVKICPSSVLNELDESKVGEGYNTKCDRVRKSVVGERKSAADRKHNKEAASRLIGDVGGHGGLL